MIELNNVSKKYGTFLAAKNISFSVKSGEIIGLLGPNGAGKTTIMKMITGYHNPHAGVIKVCDFDVLENPVQVKSHIGYLPETNPLYDDLLVYEYLGFVGESRDIPKSELSEAIDKVVQQCSLQDFIYKSISDLSKGMRQRVGLAQALIHDPDVLILDEPTSGLDPNQIKEIRTVIKQIGKKKAIILSTHILQEVEAMCDRVLIVNKGQIVAEGTDVEIAAKLKGESLFTVEIVGAVPSETITSLEAMEGINKVSVKSSVKNEQEIVQLTIRSASSQLNGEEIFDWVLSKKLKLRTLNKTSTSLESIFETLTTSQMEDIS